MDGLLAERYYSEAENFLKIRLPEVPRLVSPISKGTFLTDISPPLAAGLNCGLRWGKISQQENPRLVLGEPGEASLKAPRRPTHDDAPRYEWSIILKIEGALCSESFSEVRAA
jgi:hypothetical protein